MKLDCGDFSVRECVYSPGLRQPRHAHEHSNITVVMCGQIEEASACGVYLGRPSSVVVKTAGCEHEDRVGGFGAKTLAIEFARHSSFGRLFPPNAWRWSDATDVVRRALALHRAWTRQGHGEVESAAAALVEAVVARRSPAAPAPAWIAAMADALERGHAEPMRFATLARDFGLHPVYASRAFRRHMGVSMTLYLQTLRLQRARRALATTAVAVHAIAPACGFADASHLCRTFWRAFGLTPVEYRRLTSRG